MAIGDTCLFRVRDDEVRSFPMQRSADFGFSPDLVKSTDTDLARLRLHASFGVGNVDRR